jgi:hypothetical protein
MKRKISLKQAIRERCRDCCGTMCLFDECALKGQAAKKSPSANAVRRHCREECMNGNPVNRCASPDCPIYRHRADCEGSLRVLFLPVKIRTGTDFEA